MKVKSICGVILTTNRLEEMRSFYSNILGLPLEKEEHGDLLVHYGTDLGQVHFALHPPADFNLDHPGNATAKIAFEVENLDACIQKLASADYPLFQPARDEGFGPVASLKDPDGNLVELVELRYDFS